MKKQSGLEVCRLLCAVAVILWHYQHFWGMGADDGVRVLPGDLPFSSVLGLFYTAGRNAVETFWVISGYIFFSKYAGAIHERSVTARDFFVLRFSRLYPLHLTTLIVVLVLQLQYMRSHGSFFVFATNDAWTFGLQLVFASNWLQSQPMSFNGPIWSVSAEVLVYALFFLLLRRFRPSLILCEIVLLAAILVTVMVSQPIIYCASFFFAGGVLTFLVAGLGRRARIAGFAVGVGIIVTIGYRVSQGDQVTFLYNLLLSGGAVFAFAVIEDVLHVDLSGLSWTGEVTYSSYLLHFPLQLCAVLITDAAGFDRSLYLSPLALVAFMTTTFGAAWLVRRHFELPAQGALRTALLQAGQRGTSDRVVTGPGPA